MGDFAFQAPNRAQGFRTYFTPDGVRIVPRLRSERTWEWRVALVGVGDERGVSSPAPALPSARGNRVEYDHGDIVEWYVNGPAGLEQGFTLQRAAGGAFSEDSRFVRIGLEFGGDLRASAAPTRSTIQYRSSSGEPILAYGGLRSWDAGGHELRSYFEGNGRELWLVVEVAGACWPITIDPIASSASWIAEGDQDNAQFGISAATAGDVNGDGYSDVVVGAHLFDHGGVDAGRAFVFLGSSSGLSSSAAWTADGPIPGGEFGAVVAAAGDVNGDGYSDVAIGGWAFSDDVGTDRGQVSVFLGSRTGLSAFPNWTAEGEQSFEYFGYSLGTAGDVNGDGYSDLVVGAMGYTRDVVSGGAVFLFYGSDTGLSRQPGWFAVGDQTYERLGYAVGTAGDVNGDGYSDLIASADTYFSTDPTGRAYGWYGSAEGMGEEDTTSSADWSPADSLGQPIVGGVSIATAGDVNHDGYADVIIGSSFEASSGFLTGNLLLYRGSAQGLERNTSWYIGSNDPSFGYSVATAGDVNGDGVDDLVIGAYWLFEAGVYVYFGSAGGIDTTADWTALPPDESFESFGAVVAPAGDVNGDGFADLIVGSYDYSGDRSFEGRAYVFHGAASGLSATALWSSDGNQGDARAGNSVACAGDVNGDGFADVIVGAPLFDNGQANEGRAMVFLGSEHGLQTSSAWSFESDTPGAQFGYSVATAGDVDGDGYSDVVVGAPFLAGLGRAYLFRGSASGLQPSPARVFDPEASGTQYGWCVACAGDVNGDGFSDFAIAANLHSNGQSNEGRVIVFHGSPGGPSAAPSWSTESDQNFARYGESVATAGDVNGDGYSDLIVGAYNFNNRGRAFVYLGSRLGLAAGPVWTGDPGQASARYGVSVSSAGDVNGDGFADILVGATRFSNGSTNEGRVFAYYGSASGPSPTPSWTSESNQASAEYGYSVACAGDVDGDGFSDVVIGCPLFDAGQTDEGRVFLFLGAPAGLSESAAPRIESNQINARFGWSASTAGDVNGDGLDEFVIGAERFDNGQTDEGQAFLYGGGSRPSLRPQQRRFDDSAPIGPLGVSDRANGFRVAMLGRTPSGRGAVKMEWEVKPAGSALDGTATKVGATWADTGPDGVSLNEAVEELETDTLYHWRVRARYHPAYISFPFIPSGPWLTGPGSGSTQADVRTLARVAVVGQPTAQWSCEGGLAMFQISASGTQPISYQWRLNGAELMDGGGISGARSASLQISSIVSPNSGTYDCVVRNADSSAISDGVALEVHPIPQILEPPVRQSVRVGGRAQFSVTAAGAGPPSYQWRRGGVPLVDGGAVQGATSDRLTIDPVNQFDGGQYDVLVSDGGCALVSGPAPLTVIVDIQAPIGSQLGEPNPSK